MQYFSSSSTFVVCIVPCHSNTDSISAEATVEEAAKNIMPVDTIRFIYSPNS